MEVSIAEAFLVYGPLGATAVIGFGFAIGMFRVVQNERRKQDERNATHTAEMQAMVDRYITTTTKHVEQYNNLADKMSAVMASLSQRVRR